MLQIKKDSILKGLHGREFGVDLFYNNDNLPKPVVVFCHGFKGFKDWGTFDLVAKSFAKAGFVFVKFNFSYNGTSIESPTDFVDLEAFGNNNFIIELDDVKVVLDALESGDLPIPPNEMDLQQISLIGHSRGGGIAILKAAEDPRVKKLITWASVNEFGKYWKKEQMKEIQKNGVIYVANSRTQQQMPLYWQLYQSYFDNLERLHIPSQFRKLQIPILVAHGTQDEAVPYSCAEELKAWNKNTTLLTIEKGDHVFGGKHPWTDESLPTDLQIVVKASVDFLKKS